MRADPIDRRARGGVLGTRPETVKEPLKSGGIGGRAVAALSAHRVIASAMRIGIVRTRLPGARWTALAMRPVAASTCVVTA